MLNLLNPCLKCLEPLKLCPKWILPVAPLAGGSPSPPLLTTDPGLTDAAALSVELRGGKNITIGAHVWWSSK